MVATVSMKHGRIVEEVRRGSTVVKPASEVWDFALEDETGRVVRTRDAIIKETEIVERGPVRALIVRRPFTDARRCARRFSHPPGERRRARCAPRPHPHHQPRGDTRGHPKRWSMDLRRAGAATGKVWLSPEETRAANPERFSTSIGGYGHLDRCRWSTLAGEGKSPGHVRLPGVALERAGSGSASRRPSRYRRRAPGFHPEAFNEGDLPNNGWPGCAR